MSDIEFIFGEAGSGKSLAMAYQVTAAELRQYIERIERLEEEKKGIADDIKDVYGEAKGQGYDTKIVKQIIRLRRMEKAARDEEEALLDTYKEALGL
jgi:uncharacterized protein (UPF0335 family)